MVLSLNVPHIPCQMWFERINELELELELELDITHIVKRTSYNNTSTAYNNETTGYNERCTISIVICT